MSWIASPAQLKRRGVLGMNRRNIMLIGQHNDRRRFPLVDDKLKTKQLAEEAGIAAPGLISLIQYQHQVRRIEQLLAEHSCFCIKPAKGSGGKGILVIHDHDNQNYFKPNNQSVSLPELKRHLSNILAGLFSLGGQPDKAIIESLIHFDNRFARYSFEGVPDIRIIVFLGYPVMAMMRLSTEASDGKANLHQGAVGVGLHIDNGKAAYAVQFDKPVAEHPDTGQALDQLVIPEWRKLLIMAARCYEITGLGYLGVDIVLDAHQGPMLLELNARPGLAIQIANNVGLEQRMSLLQTVIPQSLSPLDRVSAVQQLFKSP